MTMTVGQHIITIAMTVTYMVLIQAVLKVTS
jgi:hypothetical protein